MAYASIMYGLRAAVVTTIKGLIEDGTLDGIAQDSVVNRRIPTAAKFKGVPGAGEVPFPGVVVSNGDRESIEAANNIRDDIAYPVVVAVFDRMTSDEGSSDADASDDQFQSWRQTIIDEFRHGGYTITDPSTVFHDVLIEPGPMLDWRRLQADGVYVGSFTLRFITRR